MKKLKLFQQIKDLKNFLLYLKVLDFNFSKLSEKELKKLLKKSKENLELLNKLRNFVLLDFLLIFLCVFFLMLFKINSLLLVALISGLVFLILVLQVQIDIPDSIVFIKYCIYGLKRELNKRKQKKYIWGGLR